ncbi:TPA: DNA-binding protein [Pseudomonas aeruginosa]
MKVEELPQEGFAECPRYITLMRFAFLTGLSDRPDLLYAWIESGDLPMRTFGTQRLVDMQKLQKRIEEAKKPPRRRSFCREGALSASRQRYAGP